MFQYLSKKNENFLPGESAFAGFFLAFLPKTLEIDWRLWYHYVL
jgi:hypothetical protein